MKFTLKKFLFYWDLKIFGKGLAYFGMTASVIAAVMSIVIAIFAIKYEKSEHNPKIIPFGFILLLFIVTELATHAILAGCFYFSFQLLIGVQKEIASKMKGSLFIYGMLTICFALLMFYHLAFVTGVIVFTYFWICLYSLYLNTI